LVLSCLKMGIYKTAVSKELKKRIEKIQDNLSNIKGRPQDTLQDVFNSGKIPKNYLIILLDFEGIACRNMGNIWVIYQQ